MRSTRAQVAARNAILLALADSDFTLTQYGRAFGLSHSHVSMMRRKLGLNNRAVPLHVAERNAGIEELFRAGVTLDDIGTRYGISRERCRQILSARGLAPKTSQLVRSIDHARTKELLRRGIWDQRAVSVYGCSFALALELNSGLLFSSKGSKARVYVEQRRNSMRRGIGWEITFPDWCRVWDESGRWKQRGRGRGYVMARLGDSGPYKVGNIEIITAAQNCSDSYLVISASERIAKRQINHDPAHMSPRVAQTAELVKQGKTYREIAVILSINPRNAWQCVDQAKRKLALLEERKAA